MPVSTSRYSSSYNSSFRPPSSSSTSRYSTAFDLKSSSSANYRPITRRLQSAGPGPLVTDGRKLSSDFSVRSRTPSKTRNGPPNADFSSDIGGYSSSYDTYSNRKTGMSNHDFGTSSRTVGRRSASISNLDTKDLDNLSISDTRNSRNRDYTSSYGTTPRRSSYYKHEDFLPSRSSSRTSRVSQSVDRESLYSPDHSRSYSRTSRNLSRYSSPVRERAPTPSRRYSTDKRGSPMSQTVSRTGSNSSISSASQKKNYPIDTTSTPKMRDLLRLHKEDECQICMDKQKDCAYDPCGHIMSCMGCSQEITTCPICRENISKKLKIYMS